MKRMTALFLALLMIFCGCTSDLPQSTRQESTAATTSSAEPISPSGLDFGLYEPGSAVEEQTGGAVKYFPLEFSDYYAVELMGEGLLLFSGEDTTALTLLREESDPVKVELNCFLHPDCAVAIREDGVCYYDSFAAQIVTLGPGLQEISRIAMPEDMVGTPALSADGGRVYYFSTTALRCFELDTGISRLLRDSSFAVQEVWDIHFNDAVLECFTLDGGISRYQYVSAQTGQLLAEYDTYPDLDTAGNCYFANLYEGNSTSHLTGTRGEKPQCLVPAQTGATVCPLLAINGALTYEQDAYGVSLDYYDLDLGVRSAQTRLYTVEMLQHIVADGQSGLIWLLAQCAGGVGQALYCWDTAYSATDDETSCVAPYYTAEEPDTAGLSEIARQAKVIGDKYGVRIRVWEEAGKTQPDDYTFELEHLVRVYERYLPTLDKTLSVFPEGFLKKLGKSSANGVLTIALVREVYGNNALGSLNTTTGIHFWDDGSGYIAVPMGDAEIDQNLFHEIFHAIDSYVMSECTVYDNWLGLNPDGFAYDYSYVTNQFREDYHYLEDETRSFIDTYSMSYPKEDRARIFEYAMMEGNESYFRSDIMQSKLKMLCKGIREAFNLKKYTQPLPWEQYLK